MDSVPRAPLPLLSAIVGLLFLFLVIAVFVVLMLIQLQRPREFVPEQAEAQHDGAAPAHPCVLLPRDAPWALPVTSTVLTAHHIQRPIAPPYLQSSAPATGLAEE